MKDLIDRQAAIDGFYNVKVHEEDCTEYDIGYNDGIDYAISKLSVMPSAQPDTSCDGCRYGYFGSAACDRCSRMYMDRYERKEEKDAAD